MCGGGDGVVEDREGMGRRKMRLEKREGVGKMWGRGKVWGGGRCDMEEGGIIMAWFKEYHLPYIAPLPHPSILTSLTVW